MTSVSVITKMVEHAISQAAVQGAEVLIVCLDQDDVNAVANRLKAERRENGAVEAVSISVLQAWAWVSVKGVNSEPGGRIDCMASPAVKQGGLAGRQYDNVHYFLGSVSEPCRSTQLKKSDRSAAPMIWGV